MLSERRDWFPSFLLLSSSCPAFLSPPFPSLFFLLFLFACSRRAVGFVRVPRRFLLVAAVLGSCASFRFAASLVARGVAFGSLPRGPPLVFLSVRPVRLLRPVGVALWLRGQEPEAHTTHITDTERYIRISAGCDT